MLALAHEKAVRLGLRDRVALVRGTFLDLPADVAFDAATCLFVLHFLSDDDKRALLRGTASRLRPGAAVLVASGTRVVADEGLRGDMLGTWQHYGQLAGMGAERMVATIEQLTRQQAMATTESDYVRLFHEVGFAHVAQLLSVFNGGLVAWLLR
jgi:tRNA (cmo5U34)-methyltransferase